jgi:hypothetical protein
VPITLLSTRKNGDRHIVLKVLGKHDSHSHGNAVFVDALSTKS